MQLSLELGIALHECDVDSLGLGELRFATGLLGNEARCTVGAELHAPRPEKRAVDALPAEHRSERASLSADEAGVRLTHDTELLGRAEHAARALRDGLQRCGRRGYR